MNIIAKVTTARLQKNFRALSRTLQTRCLDILLRTLANGRAELKPSIRRKDKRVAIERSPSSLNSQQSPRPASLGEKSRAEAMSYMAKRERVGKILLGEDGCAVCFTGAPGTKDRITVLTMTHLLSSEGFHFRHNTVSQSNNAVRKRARQIEKTKFFFSLPTSSVSHLIVPPAVNAKRGKVHVSTLAQGNIVAAPWKCDDEPRVEQYFLGEVGDIDETEQHQLQLPSEKLSLDLSKIDVRLVQPPATDTTETPSSPTKARRITRTAAARIAAQTPYILTLHIPPTSTP